MSWNVGHGGYGAYGGDVLIELLNAGRLERGETLRLPGPAHTMGANAIEGALLGDGGVRDAASGEKYPSLAAWMAECAPAREPVSWLRVMLPNRRNATLLDVVRSAGPLPKTAVAVVVPVIVPAVVSAVPTPSASSAAPANARHGGRVQHAYKCECGKRFTSSQSKAGHSHFCRVHQMFKNGGVLPKQQQQNQSQSQSASPSPPPSPTPPTPLPTTASALHALAVTAAEEDEAENAAKEDTMASTSASVCSVAVSPEVPTPQSPPAPMAANSDDVSFEETDEEDQARESPERHLQHRQKKEPPTKRTAVVTRGSSRSNSDSADESASESASCSDSDADGSVGMAGSDGESTPNNSFHSAASAATEEVDADEEALRQQYGEPLYECVCGKRFYSSQSKAGHCHHCPVYSRRQKGKKAKVNVGGRHKAGWRNAKRWKHTKRHTQKQEEQVGSVAIGQQLLQQPPKQRPAIGYDQLSTMPQSASSLTAAPSARTLSIMSLCSPRSGTGFSILDPDDTAPAPSYTFFSPPPASCAPVNPLTAPKFALPAVDRAMEQHLQRFDTCISQFSSQFASSSPTSISPSSSSSSLQSLTSTAPSPGFILSPTTAPSTSPYFAPLLPTPEPRTPSAVPASQSLALPAFVAPQQQHVALLRRYAGLE